MRIHLLEKRRTDEISHEHNPVGQRMTCKRGKNMAFDYMVWLDINIDVA